LNKFGIHWNEKARTLLKENISIVVGEETGNLLALKLVAVGHFFMLVMLTKGIYHVLTFNLYIDEHEILDPYHAEDKMAVIHYKLIKNLCLLAAQQKSF
jgi:hypothetical protein